MTDTSTSTEITDETRLTMLKHLASGKTLDDVATITRRPRPLVLDIVSKHGYPQSLDKGIALLTAKIEKDRRAEITEGSSIPTDPAQRATVPRPLAVTHGPDHTPMVVTRADDIATLLDTAKGHPSKKVQTQADRCLDAIDKLRTLIREDEEQNAAKRQAAADRAEARAEVDRLKAQLAAAQAALRSTTSATSPIGGGTSPVGEAATIRTWAMKQGIDVPARGRIPAEIRDQYTATHPATEPAEQAS